MARRNLIQIVVDMGDAYRDLAECYRKLALLGVSLSMVPVQGSEAWTQ